MNSNFNNPNGKILEVGAEGFSPGTTRKIIGLAVFLLCLLSLFGSFTKQSSYKKGVEKYTEVSKVTTANLAEKKLATQLAEKKVTPQSELAMQVANAETRWNEAKQAKDVAEQARKLTTTEQAEASLNYSHADESEKTATENIAKEKYENVALAMEAFVTATNDLQVAENELDVAKHAMSDAMSTYETAKREEEIIKSELLHTTTGVAEMKRNEKTEKFYPVIMLMGMGLGLLITYSGVKAAKAVAGRNANYVINSQDNTFTLPYDDTLYCKLTDIYAVNKRVESTQRREKYYEYVNGKQKERHRTVTDRTYYVQLVGVNIDAELSFRKKGIRDRLYSSLTIGVNDVRLLR